MELTPRTQDETPARRRSRRRRAVPLAVLAVLLVVLGFIVYRGLMDATTYYLNADEAVDRRDELGDSRFRLQGAVQGDATETADGAEFTVIFNCVTIGVRHSGERPSMFETGMPVVLEGRWDASGEYFASDTMFIKHDSEYQAEDEYDERVEAAEAGAADCPDGAEVAGG